MPVPQFLQEYSNIPQHIRHDEQAHMRTANVYAVQVGDSSVALRDVDVLHLHVHVVLSYCAYISLLCPCYS